MRMLSALVWATICVGLAACSEGPYSKEAWERSWNDYSQTMFTTDAQKQKKEANRQTAHIQELKAKFQTWVGHSIAEVALKAGPPQAAFDIGRNRKTFQWVNATVFNERCVVSFMATPARQPPTLADWIIDNYAWSGYCD